MTGKCKFFFFFLWWNEKCKVKLSKPVLRLFFIIIIYQLCSNCNITFKRTQIIYACKMITSYSCSRIQIESLTFYIYVMTGDSFGPRMAIDWSFCSKTQTSHRVPSHEQQWSIYFTNNNNNDNNNGQYQ